MQGRNIGNVHKTRRRRRLTGKPLTPRTTGSGSVLVRGRGSSPSKNEQICPVSVQQLHRKEIGGCDTWVGGIVPQSRLRVFIAIASAFRHPKDTRYVFPARFAQVKHTMTAIFLRASGHLAAHSAPATSLLQQATRPLPHRHEAPTQTTPTLPSRRLSKLRLKLGAFAHTIRAR